MIVPARQSEKTVTYRMLVQPRVIRNSPSIIPRQPEPHCRLMGVVLKQMLASMIRLPKIAKIP